MKGKGFRMLKKTLFVGVAAALALGLLLGSNTIGYVSTMIGNAREAVNDRIPVEVKIKNVRNEVASLRHVINQQIHEIAKEEVAVEKLESELASRKTKLNSAQAHILKLKNHLENSSDQFVHNGASYTNDQVETNLRHRFESFKTAKDTVTQMSEIVKARRTGLNAAQQKLDELKLAKSEMELEIENLQARQKMLEAKETASKFSFDNSKVAKCRELIEDIDSTLRVKDRIVNTVETEMGGIPLETKEVNTDITSEVNAYFNGVNNDLVTQH